MVTRSFLVVMLIACQGNRGSDPPRDATVARPADAPAVAADADLPLEDAPKTEEPEPADSNKTIAELGAIPAWQAVVDRAQLLARRDQHGVAYGRIGAAVMVPAPPPPAGSGSGSATPPTKPEMIASPYVWLVDDTEGNGSLAIRIALGSKAAKEGDRVAVGGAWSLDDARRWYWKVDSLQPLPPPPPSDLKDPKSELGHAIPNGDLLRGARTITVAKENEATYFQLVGLPPAVDGDGWPVANELGDPVYALLILPGERASYGGQDMRAADERWQLKRGQTYTLRIGRIRTRGPDKPAVIYARSAPIRVN